MAKYPINSKEELIAAIAELSDADVKGSGLQKIKETMESIADLTNEQLDAKTRSQNLDLDMARLQSDRLEIADQLNKYQQETNQLAAAALSDHSEEGKRLREIVAQRKAVVQSYKDQGYEISQVTEAQKKFAKQSDAVFDKYATMSGFFTKASEGVAGSMFGFIGALKESENPLGVMTASFGKFVNVTNFANSIVTKMVESTIMMVREFDSASAAFAKATGLGDKYAGTLLSIRQEANVLGANFQNVGESLKSLAEQFVGFTDLNDTTQSTLVTTGALLTRIGVSAGESASLLNTFTLNMGMSALEASNFTKELTQMGANADIASTKLISDFHAAQKVIAVYGKSSIGVFKGLSAAAKAAGVEMGSLLSIAGKFDRFESAAETVGRLNAILGTQLSSTQMLMMTEEKRVETLIQQVQAQGMNFADMDRFKQQAIAAAAGISDMNEAQRIFGMNMGQYEEYQQRMNRTANIQENFNKAVEATIPLQEKFSILMAEFAVLIEPLLEGVGMFIDLLIKMVNRFNEGEKVFIGASLTIGLLIAALFSAGPALGAAAAAFVGAGGAIATAVATIGGGVGVLAGGLGGLATAATASSVGMGLLAGAATALGAVSFAGIVSGLAQVAALINDNIQLQNTLENLALVSTGTSARAMSQGAAATVDGIRDTISAAYQQKIEITLTVNDAPLKDFIKAELKNIDKATAETIVAVAEGS